MPIILPPNVGNPQQNTAPLTTIQQPVTTMIQRPDSPILPTGMTLNEAIKNSIQFNQPAASTQNTNNIAQPIISAMPQTMPQGTFLTQQEYQQVMMQRGLSVGQRQPMVNHFDEPQSESKPSFASGRNTGFRTLPASIASAVRVPTAINQSSGNPQNAFNLNSINQNNVNTRNAFNPNINNAPSVANPNISSALGYRQPMLANTKPVATKPTLTVTNKKIIL